MIGNCPKKSIGGVYEDIYDNTVIENQVHVQHLGNRINKS